MMSDVNATDLQSLKTDGRDFVFGTKSKLCLPQHQDLLLVKEKVALSYPTYLMWIDLDDSPLDTICTCFGSLSPVTCLQQTDRRGRQRGSMTKVKDETVEVLY